MHSFRDVIISPRITSIFELKDWRMSCHAKPSQVYSLLALLGKALKPERPGLTINSLKSMFLLSSLSPMNTKRLQMALSGFCPVQQMYRLDITLTDKIGLHLPFILWGKAHIVDMQFQLMEGLNGKHSHRFYISVICTPSHLTRSLKAGKIWVSDNVEILFF